MLKRIHVYDLDGVLVDTSHRYRTDENGATDMQYWIANHTAEKIALDRLLPHAKQYLSDTLDPEIYTILCTVRTMHELDLEFIVGRLGVPDKILMVGEPHPPYTKDFILKRRALQRMFNLMVLQKLPRTLWEDNRVTIDRLADMFTHTIYVKSNQGV